MNKTYFVQQCPTCGRSLHIQVQYLGRTLTCQHCHGKVEAAEQSTAAPRESLALLERADELLNRSRIA